MCLGWEGVFISSSRHQAKIDRQKKGGERERKHRNRVIQHLSSRARSAASLSS